MPRILRAFLFWTLILSACSPGGLSVETPSPTALNNPSPTLPPTVIPESPTPVIPVSTVDTLPSTKLVATLSTPHVDQPPDVVTTVPPSNPQDCGYQWAQQALPELSGSFQQSIQALQPEAQAYAFAFGENCVHIDGSATFLPMETDFNITLQVADATDTSTLGGWIVNVMQIIEAIPPVQLAGPQPGRVTISFQSSAAQTWVSFYVSQYRSLPAGLSNAEIYQALKTPQ